jgi:hypothetical protein
MTQWIAYDPGAEHNELQFNRVLQSAEIFAHWLKNAVWTFAKFMAKHPRRMKIKVRWQ